MSQQKSALLGLFTVSLIWGCNYIASVILLRSFSPIFTSFGRITLTSVFLIIVGLVVRKLKRPTKKEWLLLVAVGIFGVFFNQTFYFTGLHHSSPTNASLIFALVPVCTILLERMFLKERLTTFKLIGVLLGFAGVVIIVGAGEGVHGISIGDIYLLLSMIAQSIGILYTRCLTASMSSYAVTIYATVIGSGFMGVSAVGEHIFSTTVISHNIYLWMLMAAAGVLSQGVAGFLWNKGVSVVGAGTSSMFLNIPPFVTLILSSLVLGEKIQMTQILGGFFVLLGVFVANQKMKPKKTTIQTIAS
ncbi:DMT family transporter [Fodinisporobacter ferrooxydans]|uniref:DMT family transporter n=1 Tax=Fodinisporobacter ferrooxydans TaxID=2901836 RepID=A0ABY4CQA6_9BACL|nr:DMT family transporter [Alicyclobacillaceae bacterium MYW30-H2]